MIEIQQLTSINLEQLEQIRSLYATLSDYTVFNYAILEETMKCSYIYVAIHDGRIVGMATLCVFVSPTGRKASVEDVVVHKDLQGQGVGRKLMEAIIEKAHGYAPITLQLTSRPQRLVANKLYPSLGFQRKETNFYILKV